MKKQFTFILIGLFFVFIDIVLSNFDILPDVIGYILIGVGAGGLQPHSVHFATARNLSWALAVFALALLILYLSRVNEQILFFCDLVIRVLDLGLIWFLLGGIRELATSRNRTGLATNAARLRLAFVILVLMTVMVPFVFPDDPMAARWLSVAIQLCIIVVLMLVFVLLFQSKRFLSNEPITGVNTAKPEKEGPDA